MTQGSDAGCAIAVMAKVPQAGRSKTRLIPTVTAQQAALLSAAFLRDTTENIAAAARAVAITGHVAYAPAGDEALLAPHMAEGTRLLLADGSGPAPDGVQGFGRCMLQAIADLLASGHGSACVLNSDGPTLPTAHLVEAARILARPGDRAVLGPAEDGGYYLLGLKHAHAGMFADIVWSAEDVADRTRARAAALDLELVELGAWFDVDDGPALARLIAGFARDDERGYHAPFTRRAVARLGLSTPMIMSC